MIKWWIGCSGFYYKGWKGKFYPADLPQHKWFEFYCESFNTVELNVTFYRLPRLSDLKNWYKRSPKDFKFTTKASRIITHYKKFKNTRDEVMAFYDRVADGLADKLGPILFQLHPTIEFSEETLERIVSTLDTSFVNALEFRHKSWWNEKVYKTLKENNITFCSISYPSLPDEIYKTTPVIYYRFHGVPQLYLSSYSEKKLASVIKDIQKKRNVEEAYLYFNNDAEVAAVSNAKTLQKLIESKNVTATNSHR